MQLKEHISITNKNLVKWQEVGLKVEAKAQA